MGSCCCCCALKESMNRHNGYTHTERGRKKNRYFVRAFFLFLAFVVLFLFTRQENSFFLWFFLFPFDLCVFRVFFRQRTTFSSSNSFIFFFFKEEEKELEERNLAVQSLLSDGMNITTARPGEPCFVFCFVCFIKVLDRPRAPARNI